MIAPFVLRAFAKIITWGRMWARQGWGRLFARRQRLQHRNQAVKDAQIAQIKPCCPVLAC
jgi:hypothetical protein